MVEYAKPWLSLDQQVAKLEARGVRVDDHASAVRLLKSIGYYRLTGYLYPFRESDRILEKDGSMRVRVLNRYLPGSSFEHAGKLIDFDRRLRLLVLDGVERIEVSLRMEIGYALGRISPFAHEDGANFVASFTTEVSEPENGAPTSGHALWFERVRARQADSDEAFVAHFRNKYHDRMPIWALTEILEMGHLGRLYGGLSNAIATGIANRYGVPVKKSMASWIASINYVRNVSAHHARLFNRKLVSAPSRPKPGVVALLDHLRLDSSSKAVFGLYNALAVMAYLLRSIDAEATWAGRLIELMSDFPQRPNFGIESMGFPVEWSSYDLWLP